ncbi:hypothetical protein J6590_063512 [Homalodisca vitripennis]|nr:hypothetical protein J6590_063512 [Homalodisca vitripennis]
MSAPGRNPRSGGNVRNYQRNMLSRFAADYARRRAQDNSKPAEVIASPPISVELTELYARDNAKSHHTDLFELVVDTPPTPVLRRGQAFFFAVRFNRPFDIHQDLVRFIFDFGPNPTITKGTRNLVQLCDKRELTLDKSKWDARLHHQDSNTITAEIQISSTCPVGIWHCRIQTTTAGQARSEIKDFNVEDDIYILFNPWCKEDGVYIESDAERQEYVLNDTGKVWKGSYRQPKGRRWIFGQFDDVVLPATMYLLEQSDVPHANRGNPVQIARAISAVVNSVDEDGLLIGKWDGDYRDGTAPQAWTGTVAIMEQYLRDGGEPVKYGQCWVFSGAVVTVCRALGIPCRSVTNYVSAHDTNCSLTVDKYFTKEGELMEGGPDGECWDSCWNYHVWNDVWMSRPDLPPGYGGWQIIDATPQEASGDLFRCGPASVEAVLRGEVGFLHDTPFVFAEVNADICHFQENPESDWGFSRLSLNQYHVGRKIVTKSVGKDDDEGDGDMEDVTALYKNPEGSFAERLAVLNAVKGVPTAQKLYEIKKRETEDVSFDLIEIDHVMFGQPFSVTVHLHNKASRPHQVTAVLSAYSVFYTGVKVHGLKRGQAEFTLHPNQKETVRITVKPEEYVDKLVDHSLVKIYAIASVKDTKQTWSEEDDFQLIKPKLSVEVKGSPKVGQACQANFSFQNPLNNALSNCSFSVEGPGLQRPKVIQYRDVMPNEMVTFSEYFTPKMAGKRKIMASFTSNQLTEVIGSTSVHVAE